MMSRPMEELCARASKKPGAKRLKGTDVLVIDEISMMENHHFERLNRVMKYVRKDRRAFGGVQLIVTGDFCQLPPVEPFRFCMECGKKLNTVGQVRRCAEHGDVLEADKWAFCSDAWRACDFAHVDLTTIHRQSDIEFITILERFRLGKPLRPEDKDLVLNHESNTEGAVQLFPRKPQVLKVNEENFIRLSTPILNYTCHDYNSELEKLKLKGKRNINGPLEALDKHRYASSIGLRVGMLVVLLANLDMNRGHGGLVNGSQGTIIRFEEHVKERLPEQKGSHKGLKSRLVEQFVEGLKEKAWPVVKFTNGREATIFPDCVINESGAGELYTLLSRTQVPLMAAWAMTVHKAQGMTLEQVTVDLAKSFEEGQDYVALSRARNLEGLKVERLAYRDRSANPEVKQFLWEKFQIQ